MLISHNEIPPNIRLYIGTVDRNQTHESKFHGIIIIDYRSCFNKQADNVLKKMSKSFGIMNRLSNIWPSHVLFKFYLSTLYPTWFMRWDIPGSNWYGLYFIYDHHCDTILTKCEAVSDQTTMRVTTLGVGCYPLYKYKHYVTVGRLVDGSAPNNSWTSHIFTTDTFYRGEHSVFFRPVNPRVRCMGSSATKQGPIIRPFEYTTSLCSPKNCFYCVCPSAHVIGLR